MAKDKTEKLPNEYEPCSEELQDLAAQIIANHHPHLQGARIVYVSRTEPATLHGENVLATAKKVTGLNAYLADFHGTFFVIEVCEKLLGQLEEKVQLAVLDHNLSRCRVTNGRLYIADYDVKEFTGVLYRHGAYQQRLRDFIKVALNRQPELEIVDGEQPTEMDKSLAGTNGKDKAEKGVGKIHQAAEAGATA